MAGLEAQMKSTVILGNGNFPQHSIPLKILKEASAIFCTDGAADALIQQLGIVPTAIVGDLDSVSEETKDLYPQLLWHFPDQATNDLQKTVQFAKSLGCSDLVVLGIFGGREDHAIANFSLLWKLNAEVPLVAYSDFGTFSFVHGKTRLRSYPGQQVSIFARDGNCRISCSELKWPLSDHQFTEFWQGTLNEATSSELNFRTEEASALIFQTYLV